MLRLLTIPPAPQVLGPNEIERLAGLTTRAGLTTEIAGVKEVAAPYMEMNTKELLLEGAKLVKMGGVEVRPNPNPDPNPDPNREAPNPSPSPNPSPNPNQGAKLVNASILQPSYARVDEGLLQPAKARATEAKARATPYVAPYIARGLDTKDAVLSDVRCPQPAPAPAPAPSPELQPSPNPSMDPNRSPSSNPSPNTHPDQARVQKAVAALKGKFEQVGLGSGFG